MNVRGRRLAIFLPVVVTVVLAAVIGALVVVQDQRQSSQVSEAEAVGNAYLDDVSAFRARVVKTINASKASDPGRLRVLLDRSVAKPPTLASASSYGMEHSQAYGQALRTRDTLLPPYRRLSSVLRRADIALDFIAAARKALGLRATDYVSGLITSSGPVRDSLIPAFVAARDEFARARVPKGQDDLAAQVTAALQYVIDQATTLADMLDRFQSFSFSYSEKFQAAIDAVDGYATQVKGDVAEAINAVSDAG